ncbi:D-aminopeptidase [Fusarium oxysporum f. sp. narcissi]|uniref:D-aminopeptidase n=2 Tax=Fusarium oxysporum TaxID=5507 RepID=A0A4Q2VTQ7_FUSOX|nr:hypothetical protein FOWG_01892 [Fusarium oxysporum f. sp. lycopersici MN25]RKK22176.1 D-aminopeptidase [Fusarium oxysporum f. sp. cepae]RKK43626.1 D-aminopeptidase [Fusarium oxysporum f. sp. cepae]RKK54995.1 D-aminopeptidase [Fusarium oxysporum f. sp. cepae]RYC89941.1 D-aminopeptidase [Fusarium oxysporum f. sp. narcissi]
MPVSKEIVQDILKAIPARIRGPGGAVAVLSDGALVDQRVWGYADFNRRIPMTDDTLIPICSISKQMLCGLVADLEKNPTPKLAEKGDVKTQFEEKLKEILPELAKTGELKIDHLCNNRSGIRDYWAITLLWGAKPEDPYSIAEHNEKVLKTIKSTHFTPGTEYSYCNTNFNIVARVVEATTGESLSDLLNARIFRPAGMKTAQLGADTAKLPPPCVGYEGDEDRGYIPAENRIEWAGDAGIIASLGDMIAYESFLDRSLFDPNSWYRAIFKPTSFTDGVPSIYSQGLGHSQYGSVSGIGHGGALRGFRLYRAHVPEERLSVVAMFNHEADAATLVEHIIQTTLALQKPPPPTLVDASPAWPGIYLDDGTQLAVTIKNGKKGQIVVNYANYAEPVNLTDPERGESRAMVAVVDGDNLRIHRLKENRTLNAKRLKIGDTPVDNSAFTGDFYSEEIGSIFHCVDQGGLMFGTFEGFLGHSPAQFMRYLGGDVWALANPRGMDAKPPGDWTLVFRRDEKGAVVGVTIGCWLARKIEFVKK